jgi:hypothetical protein
MCWLLQYLELSLGLPGCVVLHCYGARLGHMFHIYSIKLLMNLCWCVAIFMQKTNYTSHFCTCLTAVLLPFLFGCHVHVCRHSTLLDIHMFAYKMLLIVDITACLFLTFGTVFIFVTFTYAIDTFGTHEVNFLTYRLCFRIYVNSIHCKPLTIYITFMLSQLHL